jgi:glycosyltransferase involved in cell wall biosynthesis
MMHVVTPKISATVITKDEEVNIAGCLQSLAWTDEIIVLDSGSNDKTVEIAKTYTDKVFVETWRGQGRQKNRAVELAAGPWIVSLDADERISPELAREIRRAIGDDVQAAFAVRRKNMYQGKWIRHCGWWPDWVKRVFKKNDAHFSTDAIHDSLQTAGSVKRLKNPILHYSFNSPEDFLTRTCSYAHHQAIEMHRNGRRASAWTAISHAVFAFLHTYITRLGFLDGTAGVLISVSNFVGVFYRYMMLRHLNLNADISNRHNKI